MRNTTFWHRGQLDRLELRSTMPQRPNPGYRGAQLLLLLRAVNVLQVRIYLSWTDWFCIGCATTRRRTNSKTARAFARAQPGDPARRPGKSLAGVH
eukprot:14271049-Alexandrium_andersonii.AAC.1